MYIQWINAFFQPSTNLSTDQQVESKKKYSASWTSHDQRCQILEFKQNPSVVVFKINHEDGSGSILLHLDSLAELRRQLKIKKLRSAEEGFIYREKWFEKGLLDPQHEDCTHRFTISHVYPVKSPNTKKFKRIHWILDADFDGKPTQAHAIAKHTVLHLLNLKLPANQSDWSFYVLNYFWETLITSQAKKLLGETHDPKITQFYPKYNSPLMRVGNTRVVS